MNETTDLANLIPTLGKLAVFLHDSGSDMSLEQATTEAISTWILRCKLLPEQQCQATAASANSATSATTSAPTSAPTSATTSATTSAITTATATATAPATATTATSGARLAAGRAAHAGEPSSDSDVAERGYQWKCLFLPHSTRLRMHVDGASHEAQVVGDRILYQGRSVSPRGLTIAVAGPGRNAWRDVWVRLPGDTCWKLASVLRRALRQAQVIAPLQPGDTLAASARRLDQVLDAVTTLVARVRPQDTAAPERRVDRFRRSEDVMQRYGPDPVYPRNCASDPDAYVAGPCVKW